MLPTYLVIGAAKCGTTTICSLVGQHPQAFISDPKELQFFGSRDAEKTLAWYESFFEGATGKIAVGEGSPSYTRWDIIEACASEIAELIPDCRLIYMVRNPLKRLESDWKMRYSWWGKEAEIPINQAVQRELNGRPQGSHDSLISLGLYWQNLNVYYQHFAKEQILIVFLEDLAKDRDRELRRCLTHVGVDPDLPLSGSLEARNRAVDRRKYSSLGNTLRRLGLLKFAKRHAPSWAAEVARPYVQESGDLAVEWDPAVRSAVLDRMKADSAALLDYCGKPANFWTYD